MRAISFNCLPPAALCASAFALAFVPGRNFTTISPVTTRPAPGACAEERALNVKAMSVTVTIANLRRINFVRRSENSLISRFHLLFEPTKIVSAVRTRRDSASVRNLPATVRSPHSRESSAVVDGALPTGQQNSPVRAEKRNTRICQTMAELIGKQIVAKDQMD